ncbi:phosphoglycerate kinase-like isoform X1 [Salvia hispanica]|uniref:phosphoglycerate kinase-like isoform X1 n=1 Tax=Salvia hispanica TaxID=49212 RepID=UPI0020098926|nr:phosphoglycerate kinase-like isoform X1 [Salvia hispanica]
MQKSKMEVVDLRRINIYFNCQIVASNSLKLKAVPDPRNLSLIRTSHLSTSPTPVLSELVHQTEHPLAQEDYYYDAGKFAVFPNVQFLRNFPRNELFGKVVMVRFDTLILLQGMKEHKPLPENAFFTIRYLYNSRAKVILVGSWNESANPKFNMEGSLSTKSVADFLSSMLELEVVPVKRVSGFMHLDVDDIQKPSILLVENLFCLKGERANCSEFAKELTSGVDIIVNDAFSESHKVLASTVGAAKFCNACISGFYFEEGLYKLKEIIKITERPYMAVIGGSKLADKAAALQSLVSTCDGLVFVGNMAFQIMHALGTPVPMKLVETGALEEAARIVEFAKSRNIPVVLPQDIWCITDHVSEKIQIASVHSIPEGWQPVDIGPRSLEEMAYFLSVSKKITWLGPLRFSSRTQDTDETFKLAEALGTLSNCNVTFVGKMEFEESVWKSKSYSHDNFLKSAAVVWEVLKGGKLPGLLALDRAYPFVVDWSVVYDDPMRPLVVDVGSGNGLFLFGMGRRRNDMNFLGLEMNAKLVDRCLDDVHQHGTHNVHFIATNATSTFRSIVSSYPGDLFLVSIQCPNPDFNKPQFRWRMLQRSLVEAIADNLVQGGQVFLQSDIEAVAKRMKEEFLMYGKGKLEVMETEELGWLKENPLGVPSDWERHVLGRGDPMYRLLLSKVENRD